MTTIAEALKGSTIAWKRRDDGWELRDGDEVLARLDSGAATVDGRRLTFEHGRGYTSIVDAGTGARRASIRLVSHLTGRVGQVTLASHRLRISKQGILPFQWKVTDGIGGPTLYDVLCLGGQVRIRANKGMADEAAAVIPADIVVLMVALATIDELSQQAISASPAA